MSGPESIGGALKDLREICITLQHYSMVSDRHIDESGVRLNDNRLSKGRN
jgi:hypothetical protein